jgi:mono/diheme cytochrome c family protein
LAAGGCSHIGVSESNSIFISRYTEYMWGDIPDQYADLSNPLAVSKMNISDGEKLYQMQCLTCHGKAGDGDGPTAKQLFPSPANLAFSRGLPIATDTFYFWTISEGGKPFDSAMPAFRERLSDKEIWQITHYINAGFNVEEGT